MEPPARGASTKTIAIASVCAVMLAGMFLYLLLGGTRAPTTQPTGSGENQLEAAKKLLAEDTDYNTCRTALTQLNEYCRQEPQDPRPGLDAGAREALRNLFSLTDDEIAELESTSYTLLDAHYLDQCFLLRDAARSLAAAGETPLEQAAAAFRWVVRQVRLEETTLPAVPPEYALRRGWGTALDRAFVFLGLLQQLDGVEAGGERAPLRGCLVCWPGKENEPPQVWACGVLIGADPDLYLFDPRVGLPLPGKKGEGVATLAEVRKDPSLLAPLTVNPDYPYDATPEQVRAAELYHYCPLSALAPRLGFLQDRVLPRSVRAAFAADAAGERKKLEAAAAARCEDAVPVKAWPRGAEELRQFLPKAEGGAGASAPVQAFAQTLIPRDFMPVYFRNEAKFPVNIGLGQVVWNIFTAPFFRALEPKQAHELMLRGTYDEPINRLYEERKETAIRIQEARKLENDPGLGRRLDAWVDDAIQKYAAFLKAEHGADKAALEAARQDVEAVWRDPVAADVKTLLEGASARKRRSDTTYYLALCKHELAELAQARADPAARAQAPGPAAREWKEALDWWERYTGEYSKFPEAWAARRQQGLALAALGRRDEAIKVWEEGEPDDKRPLDKFEKVACLYLAKQAKK